MTYNYQPIYSLLSYFRSLKHRLPATVKLQPGAIHFMPVPSLAKSRPSAQAYAFGFDFARLGSPRIVVLAVGDMH